MDGSASSPGIQQRASSLFLVSVGIVGVCVFLFIALLNREWHLALLSVLVLGLAFGTRFWTEASLSKFDCRLKVDRLKIFPGEKAVITLQGENRKLLPLWLEAVVTVRGHEQQGVQRTSFSAEQGVLWYQGIRFQWEFVGQRRGVHVIGPVHARAGDLFGFFQKYKAFDRSTAVIVYPRIVPIHPFTFTRRDFFGIAGDGSPVQDPVYILGTTDYRSGRPAKYIHWKASARHYRLQEKIFEPSEHEKALLVLDAKGFAESGDRNAFERTIEALASVAVDLDRKGCATAFVTNGIIVNSQASTATFMRSGEQPAVILEKLARLTMQPPQQDITAVLRDSRLPWGVTCLSFVRGEDESCRNLEAYFRSRKMAYVIFTFERHSPGEEAPLTRARNIRGIDEVLIKEDGRL